MSARSASAHESAHNPVQNAMRCTDASDCTHGGPGHRIRSLQARVAAATPSKWRDAIVRDVAQDGWIAVELFESGEVVWVWHHADLSDALVQSDPVALHGLYNTLAVGERLVSVLLAPAAPTA